MAKPPNTDSPLKQVNHAGQPRRSKLDACWHDLTHIPTLFSDHNQCSVPPPKRYFSEFFCLNPNRATQDRALAALSNDDLLGPYKNNISLLFIHAVRTLKEAKPDDSCRSHAVETLFPLLRNILSREYANQSYDVINILAGSLDRSDQVFTDLVSAIDLALQDRKTPTALRHRALQLALVVVSTVGQGSLVAYFLRRDLFSTLVSFVADAETKPFAFEATLLLGLLANYRKCEARNPYGVRIEDFVEEGVMERMIDVVSTVCTRARDAYVATSDDAPPTLVASLTSFVWSLRLADLFSGGFYLPPPPPPPPVEGAVAAATAGEEEEAAGGGSDGPSGVAATAVGGEEKSGPTAAEKGKGKEKDVVVPLDDESSPPAAPLTETSSSPELLPTAAAGAASSSSSASPSFSSAAQQQVNATPTPTAESDPISSPSSPVVAEQSKSSEPSAPASTTAAAATTITTTTAASSSSPRPASALSRTSSTRPGSVRPEDAPFVDLPPAMTVLLLPFHELLDSNKTFCSLVYNDRSEGGGHPPLPVELISLVSYMVCHAALSHRARVYSRLAFVILMILVEEGEGKLTQPWCASGGDHPHEIRICRQRQPQLPQKDPSRSIPLSALIDTLVLFLRHNLRKRLDVETYTIALRLLQRVFQQLKNEGCKLNRDWVVVWRTLLSLASFIVTHRAELRQQLEHSPLDALISQLFVTLAYAAYWSEQLLPDPATQARLYYELLHADASLSALSDLLGISSVSPPLSSSSAPNSNSGTASPTTSTTTTKSPVSTYPYLSRRETGNQSGFLSLHSTLSSSSPSGLRQGGGYSTATGTAKGKENARFVATECIANLRSTITFFSGHISAFREAKRLKEANSWWPPRRYRSSSSAAPGGGVADSSLGTTSSAATTTTTASEAEDHLEPDEILSVVQANLGSIELIESAAMGDLPRYANERSDLLDGGGDDARFWKDVVEIACSDTISLLQDEPPVLPPTIAGLPPPSSSVKA